MTRISKAQARKLFNEGKPFFMVACNLQPKYGILINYNEESHKDFTSFEQLFNSFVYYNCSHETGYYPAYYIDEE